MFHKTSTPAKCILFVSLFLCSIAGINAQDYLPAVEVTNEVGASVDISQYVADGSPKIVSLWATWCGPCRMELNALKEVADKWKEEYDLEIVTVSVDIPLMVGRARKMFESNDWDFTFFHDHNQELMSKLNIDGIPYSMLIDGEGKIQSVQTGYYPNYEKKLEKKIKNL